jgi:AraC family transcriptional regulator
MLDSELLQLDSDGCPAIDLSTSATDGEAVAGDRLDETMRHLQLAIAAALAQPEKPGSIFMYHIRRAVAAVDCACRDTRVARPATRGGLAPWQQKQATDLLVANLSNEISLAMVAKACRLSPGHFARAFRASIGVPPHQWLLRCRVDKAQEMMRTSDSPLAEIALACGFADQSHLTRVFACLCGISPGSWRRHHAAEGPARRSLSRTVN